MHAGVFSPNNATSHGGGNHEHPLSPHRRAGGRRARNGSRCRVTRSGRQHTDLDRRGLPAGQGRREAHARAGAARDDQRRHVRRRDGQVRRSRGRDGDHQREAGEDRAARLRECGQRPARVPNRQLDAVRSAVRGRPYRDRACRPHVDLHRRRAAARRQVVAHVRPEGPPGRVDHRPPEDHRRRRVHDPGASRRGGHRPAAEPGSHELRRLHALDVGRHDARPHREERDEHVGAGGRAGSSRRSTSSRASSRRRRRSST